MSDPSSPTHPVRRRRQAALGAVCVSALAAGLAGCSPGATPAARTVTTPTAPATPAGATGAVTRAIRTATPTAVSAPVAVYYLADTGSTGPRLYREFHRRSVAGGAIRSALDAMLHDPPADPDYTSLWPRATTIRSVQVTGELATVDLSAAALRGSAGSAFEVASVQQLVWTVTAAEPSVHEVRVLIEGRAHGPVDGREVADLWGAGGLARQPLRRAAAYAVLPSVWLLSPATGSVVGPDVRLGGESGTFEGVVSWSVRRAGTLVRSGTTTGVGGPGRGPWAARLRLDPGHYQASAWESSARDGSVLYLDTKDFTVR